MPDQGPHRYKLPCRGAAPPARWVSPQGLAPACPTAAQCLLEVEQPPDGAAPHSPSHGFPADACKEKEETGRERRPQPTAPSRRWEPWAPQTQGPVTPRPCGCWSEGIGLSGDPGVGTGAPRPCNLLHHGCSHVHATHRHTRVHASHTARAHTRTHTHSLAHQQHHNSVQWL